MKEFDTICAIATALGEGGIAIIRISGDKALDIAHIVSNSFILNPPDFPFLIIMLILRGA